MGFEKKIFAARLRSSRLDAGLTGEDLARLAGLKRPFITNLESGARCPSVEALSRLAEALSVSADYLLDLPGSVPPPRWVADLLPEMGSLDKAGREAVRALVKGLAKKD